MTVGEHRYVLTQGSVLGRHLRGECCGGHETIHTRGVGGPTQTDEVEPFILDSDQFDTAAYGDIHRICYGSTSSTRFGAYAGKESTDTVTAM